MGTSDFWPLTLIKDISRVFGEFIARAISNLVTTNGAEKKIAYSQVIHKLKYSFFNITQQGTTY